MRILLITQIVPYPPDSGPKVKTRGVLRYLARTHEVHLVSFARSEAEDRGARSLAGVCASVTTVPIKRSRTADLGYFARSLVTDKPFLIERDDSSAMRAAIERKLDEQDFDAVHADQLSMAQFAMDLPLRLRVLDEHNAVWTIVQRAAANERWGPKRLLAELEWRRLREYERRTCEAFDVVTVVSDQDLAALTEAAGPRFNAQVIPIAVDTEEMAFRPRTAESQHVVSVATMYYPPNAQAVKWFAETAFPIVRREFPEVRFYVAGSRPPRSILALARPDSGVVVAGYVDDLDPVYRRAALMIVPLQAGSGMRVKILEAFARGVPVVSTTIGAEGIGARPGEHLLLGDTPEELAHAVSQILRDPRLGARLALAARKLVESRYDWRTALSGLDAVYAPAGGRTVEDLSPDREPQSPPGALKSA